MPGFPMEVPFESKEEVLAYLSGDRITCLLCGKQYRRLGNHLGAIHGVTEDYYREKYRIPWTYGLNSAETTAAYARAAARTIEIRKANGWDPHETDMEGMRSAPRRVKPYVEVGNLGDHTAPKHPLEPGPDGRMETFSARRKRTALKRGTPEFHEMARNRPQVAAAKEMLRTYWKGRKQSAEHRNKRLKAIFGPDWEPKD